MAVRNGSHARGNGGRRGEGDSTGLRHENERLQRRNGRERPPSETDHLEKQLAAARRWQAAPFATDPKGARTSRSTSTTRRRHLRRVRTAAARSRDAVSQYQEELPVVRPVVRRFDIEVGHCSQCQRRVQGRHVLQTSDALGAAGVQLSRVVALVVELHTELGVPLATCCGPRPASAQCSYTESGRALVNIAATAHHPGHDGYAICPGLTGGLGTARRPASILQGRALSDHPDPWAGEVQAVLQAGLDLRDRCNAGELSEHGIGRLMTAAARRERFAAGQRACLGPVARAPGGRNGGRRRSSAQSLIAKLPEHASSANGPGRAPPQGGNPETSSTGC